VRYQGEGNQNASEYLNLLSCPQTIALTLFRSLPRPRNIALLTNSDLYHNSMGTFRPLPP